ncbi:MAG: ATP synthase F1 subunit epsilon [Elusimicrobiales bacterium]
MNKLKLTILTPEKVLIEDKEVDSVTIPAWEGEMTVLYDHIPYMAQLKEGILKYRDGEKEEYMSIFWGYFEVDKNNVVILAEDAKISKEIDEEKTRQEYQKIKEALITADKKQSVEDLEIELKKIIVNLKLSDLKKKQKR